ncbi:unnamed protein product [Protopolystoma xenopodis]|uniref:CSC1/OSCA1-like 7TM region domain-containing protein n=1 Tax=Protopolystoma xenopodis TaxID=117903 RepID=A0A3S5CP93_9PLAT|nr:unnamed protein product [Protopolystoma xenopodis]
MSSRLPAFFQWLFPISDLDGRVGNSTNSTNPLSNTSAINSSFIEKAVLFVNGEAELAASGLTPLFRWECVFMPENGAFFVNYVITSAFIGTASTLVRLPQLLHYIFRLMSARSEAETVRARQVMSVYALLLPRASF